jgi:hypothetical protein
MPAPRARLASWATALCVLIAPDFASAEIPIGSFEFELGGVNSLWMGGDEDTLENADGFCVSFGRSFDFVEACNYRLTVDGRGKIDGYVSFAGLLAVNRIAVEGPIKGSQRGDNRSGITRASFQIRLAGSASRGAAALATSVNLAFDGQVDAGGVLNGAWAQSVCYAGFPCTTSGFSAGPTTWTNGHWTLALEVEHLGAGALGGVAQIQVGDDTTCDFNIRGRYNANKDVASIALSPTSPRCAGGSLRLRSLASPPSRLGKRFRAELQYKLFGISGTTVVDTEAAVLYRLLLEHYHDSINSPLPPPVSTGSSSSGSTMLLTVIQWPPGPLPQSPASQSASASSVSAGVSDATFDLLTFLESATASPAASPSGAVLGLDAMADSALLQRFRPATTTLVLPGVVPLAP